MPAKRSEECKGKLKVRISYWRNDRSRSHLKDSSLEMGIAGVETVERRSRAACNVVRMAADPWEGYLGCALHVSTHLWTKAYKLYG